MSKVLKLGISKTSNQAIKEVDSIEVLSNKGVVGDRHFKDFNDPYCQLTLIESENIDYYNAKYGLDLNYISSNRHVPRLHHWMQSQDRAHGSDCHLTKSVVHLPPKAPLSLWKVQVLGTGILRFLLKLIILQ